MSLRLLNGDCVKKMESMDSESIDSIICDPPYGLRFMAKNWDDMGDGASQRKWHDGWLKEAFRVLKSGGVIKAFSGTRTFHHLLQAMDTVGFTEIKLEAWTYGSGFPKSLNIGKNIDKITGFDATAPASKEAEQWSSWGTALKPSWEPICVGRKP